MKRGLLYGLNTTLVATLWWAATTFPPASQATVSQASHIGLTNVIETNGNFTLSPGPKVEGVVFLQGGRWKDATVQTFNDIPWVDAASVRVSWAEFERQDQVFNWEPFDRMLTEVKKYNAAHPGAHRTLQIRTMGGRHCPKWFESAGVRYYDTTRPEPGNWQTPLHAPMPFDNPEFLKQLRQMYRAMYERYQDEPLVTVYHGTWSAGPWDEIFHPRMTSPLPPGYTQEKFIQGMIEQADVLIEEFCLKGKVAELPYTGEYPTTRVIDFLGPLTRHITARLGKRSPYFYAQSNGWGLKQPENRPTIAWDHERDLRAALGHLNLGLQALGSNAGGKWVPQGDWLGLIQLAQEFEVAYTEIYEPDFLPLDVPHHIVEAFTQPPGQTAGGPKEFVGFRPWLQQRQRVLYEREGIVRTVFRHPNGTKKIARIRMAADVPTACSVKCRVRMRTADGGWTAWFDTALADQLPVGDEVEIEATLHTDDGSYTPALRELQPVWMP
ncbi:MAG: hypothetical protein WCO56_22575 [Verrucomicrobiota bacterium]